MSAPAISVLLAAHEDSPFLDGALDSVLAQTETDWELVVVADGAPVSVLRRLKARRAADPRLRVIEQPRLGLTAALNRGLEETRGVYVARLDADDRSAPRRLERQRRFVEETGADIASCHSRVLDERDRLIARREPPSEPALLRAALERSNCLPHSALFARRESLVKLGGYRPSFTYTQDYDLYLRALAGGFKLGVVGECLVDVRMTPTNITTARRREQLGFALAAQADYFQATGRGRAEAWLAMRHHLVRYWTPDALRRAKRRVLEAFR